MDPERQSLLSEDEKRTNGENDGRYEEPIKPNCCFKLLDNSQKPLIIIFALAVISVCLIGVYLFFNVIGVDSWIECDSQDVFGINNSWLLCLQDFAVMPAVYLLQIVFSFLWILRRIAKPSNRDITPSTTKMKIALGGKIILLLACAILVDWHCLREAWLGHRIAVVSLITFVLGKVAWAMNLLLCIINMRDNAPHAFITRLFWFQTLIGMIWILGYATVEHGSNTTVPIIYSVCCAMLAFWGVLGVLRPEYETSVRPSADLVTQQILKVAKKNWVLLSFGVAITFCQGSAYIFSLWTTGNIVSDAQASGKSQNLGIFFMFAGLSSVLRGLQEAVFGDVKERMVYWAKKKTISSILRQESNYLESMKKSNLQFIANECCETLGSLFQETVARFFNASGKIIIGVILLYNSSWRMSSLLLLLAVLAMCFIVWRSFVLSAKYSKRYTESRQPAADKSLEIIEKMQTIRWYKRESSEKETLRKYLGESYRIGAKTARLEGFFEFLEYLAFAAITISGLWFGSFLISRDLLSISDFTTFGFISSAFVDATYEIILCVKRAAGSSGNLKMLFELITRVPDQTLDGQPKLPWRQPINLKTKDLPENGDVVRFENVTVQDGENYRVKDLSFSIPQGKIVAVVGASGAGKSTCLQLIHRRILPTFGKIKIFGKNIAKAPISFLYSKILVVPQESVIFYDTVDNNLCYGTEEENVLERQRNFLTETGIQDIRHKFPIRQLTPQERENSMRNLNVQTPPEPQRKITEDQLSGGERQRIAIGRALFRDPNPKLLILDEITSALDPVTQTKIMKLIIEHVRKNNLACLIIAHRLKTIQEADEVIVLQKAGKEKDWKPSLVERGSPMELRNNPNSMFRVMCQQESLDEVNYLQSDNNNNKT